MIGILMAFGLVFVGIQLGGSIASFIEPISILIVFGGTVGIILVSYSLKTLLSVFGVFMKTVIYKVPSPADVVETLLSYSQAVRRDGLLALESELGSVDNDFLEHGLRMAIDGHDPEFIEEVLYLEIDKANERHLLGAEIFANLGAYAPAMGMIGTLIGLVLMLQNMSDPSTIGPAMAVALLTTFYGALLANLVFLPISNKLKVYNKEEIALREMIVVGLLSLVKGENPRLAEEKLLRYLPPNQRISVF